MRRQRDRWVVRIDGIDTETQASAASSSTRYLVSGAVKASPAESNVRILPARSSGTTGRSLTKPRSASSGVSKVIAWRILVSSRIDPDRGHGEWPAGFGECRLELD